MEGMRKFWVVVIGVVAALIGLGVSAWFKLEVSVLTAFLGADVALCGLFFGYNIKEHK